MDGFSYSKGHKIVFQLGSYKEVPGFNSLLIAPVETAKKLLVEFAKLMTNEEMQTALIVDLEDGHTSITFHMDDSRAQNLGKLLFEQIKTRYITQASN